MSQSFGILERIDCVNSASIPINQDLDYTKIMNKYEKQIKQIILNEINSLNIKIVLFGSRARNEACKTSDYDLALDAGKQINNKLLRQIRSKLEDSIIPYKVDIVDFAAVSLNLQKQIVKEGIEWR
jgi:predicted nucleotidyltransferase